LHIHGQGRIMAASFVGFSGTSQELPSRRPPREDLGSMRKETDVARTSYQYEKRRKELAKKKRNEEKGERKLAKKNPLTAEGPDSAPGEEESAQPDPAVPLPSQAEIVEIAPRASLWTDQTDEGPSPA